MAKIFEFPPAQDSIPAPENHQFENTRSNEAESHFPVVNSEESRFIETTGGAYRGFVETRDGGREFQDYWVTRTSFYDETHKRVVEVLVATDGTNDEGSNELHTSRDLVGFKMMIVRRTQSGEELGSPEFFPVCASDFPAGRLTINELRIKAQKLHKLAVEEAPQLDMHALRSRLEESLREQGWRVARSS
jgi:hypothetical protein